jgi:hypothetical protein
LDADGDQAYDFEADPERGRGGEGYRINVKQNYAK